MPTYSYRCSKCEKVFDTFHSMSCTSKQYCTECGCEGTKLLSASSVIFKGSGFYSTDYRDSGYLEAKKNDSKTTETVSNSSPKETEKKTETVQPEVKKINKNEVSAPKPSSNTSTQAAA